jgi:hypothetical protein
MEAIGGIAAEPLAKIKWCSELVMAQTEIRQTGEQTSCDPYTTSVLGITTPVDSVQLQHAREQKWLQQQYPGRHSEGAATKVIPFAPQAVVECL